MALARSIPVTHSDSCHMIANSDSCDYLRTVTALIPHAPPPRVVPLVRCTGHTHEVHHQNAHELDAGSSDGGKDAGSGPCCSPRGVDQWHVQHRTDGNPVEQDGEDNGHHHQHLAGRGGR